MPAIRYVFGIISLGILAACGGQNTRDATQPVTIGAGVGSMGLMVQPSFQTSHKTSVRVPIGFGNADFSTTVDGIDYDVSGSIGGVGVVGDYYPSAGSFRVSGGLIKTNLEANGRATGNIAVGANTYVGVDLRTKVEPNNSVAPMVSVGFDGHIGKGWGVNSDIGAMYIGGLTATATDANGTVSQTDLDAEVSEINDELSEMSVVPFINLGATYRW